MFITWVPASWWLAAEEAADQLAAGVYIAYELLIRIAQ